MNDHKLALRMYILRKEIENYNNSDLSDYDLEIFLEKEKQKLLTEYYSKTFGENVIPFILTKG